MMNKSMLVAEVLALYDEIDDLNKRLAAARAFSPEPEEGRLNARLLEYAKDALFRDCVPAWSLVADFSGDGMLSFEVWRDRTVKGVPDFVSREQLYSLLDTRLRAKYAELVADWEERHAKDDEDE